MAHERPEFLAGTDLAQLYARGQLPTAPDDPRDLEFGPVGTIEPTEPEQTDAVEAFCVAWAMGFAPDSPELRDR